MRTMSPSSVKMHPISLLQESYLHSVAHPSNTPYIVGNAVRKPKGMLLQATGMVKEIGKEQPMKKLIVEVSGKYLVVDEEAKTYTEAEMASKAESVELWGRIYGKEIIRESPTETQIPGVACGSRLLCGNSDCMHYLRHQPLDYGEVNGHKTCLEMTNICPLVGPPTKCFPLVIPSLDIAKGGDASIDKIGQPA